MKSTFLLLLLSFFSFYVKAQEHVVNEKAIYDNVSDNVGDGNRTVDEMLFNEIISYKSSHYGKSLVPPDKRYVPYHFNQLLYYTDLFDAKVDTLAMRYSSVYYLYRIRDGLTSKRYLDMQYEIILSKCISEKVRCAWSEFSEYVRLSFICGKEHKLFQDLSQELSITKKILLVYIKKWHDLAGHSITLTGLEEEYTRWESSCNK